MPNISSTLASGTIPSKAAWRPSPNPAHAESNTNPNRRPLPFVPASGSRTLLSRSDHETTLGPWSRNPARGGGDRITCSYRRRTGTAAAPAPSGAACGGTSGPCAPSARTRTRPPSGGCCGGGGVGAGRSPGRRSPSCQCRTRTRRPGTAPWLPTAAAALVGVDATR